MWDGGDEGEEGGCLGEDAGRADRRHAGGILVLPVAGGAPQEPQEQPPPPRRRRQPQASAADAAAAAAQDDDPIRAAVEGPSVLSEPVAGDAPDEPPPQPPAAEAEAERHKICVGFGQPETSDVTVVLYGKEGIAVRMSVHGDVLRRSSAFFAEKLSSSSSSSGSGGHGHGSCLEIHDCDDAEIYVETVGLMYCDEAKHKLLKQNVSRVLRIMKVIFADDLNSTLQWTLSVCVLVSDIVQNVLRDLTKNFETSIMREIEHKHINLIIWSLLWLCVFLLMNSSIWGWNLFFFVVILSTPFCHIDRF